MDKLLALFSAVKEAGLRKVLVGLFMFSGLSSLMFLGKIQDATYQACMLAIIAALFAANAAEHMSNKDKPEG